MTDAPKRIWVEAFWEKAEPSGCASLTAYPDDVAFVPADIADEMLEALKGLRHALLQIMDDPSRADDMWGVIAARAAIDKAEGGDA